ncbi:hypothetical protein [Noviherbaspirillum sp.]|uniref:hypothetical protein n=1 Tax=Noviherbaspirillum sp. TaxID=1926288 RepID=UPI002D524888|nr:hypothetical protein [Noviherbaspirillum sp.]HZW21805.1 hypothetical protein [Noviherbaspirillum sp.]
MRPYPVLISLAASAFATAALAQSPAKPSEPAKSSGSSASQSAAGKASYGTDDCRKDLENARDAKQAGHITEKEYAEQKKMAQTKLKRDSGQAASAAQNVECK